MQFISLALRFTKGRWRPLLAGLALVMLLGWGMRLDALRASWKARFEHLSEISDGVLRVTREASANQALTLDQAADAISAIATAKREWKATSELQSARIDELGIESARLKALNADLRARAEAAIAKREQAVKRLQTQSLDPGERADCAAQIFAANAALDLVYREGL